MPRITSIHLLWRFWTIQLLLHYVKLVNREETTVRKANISADVCKLTSTSSTSSTSSTKTMSQRISDQWYPSRRLQRYMGSLVPRWRTVTQMRWGDSLSFVLSADWITTKEENTFIHENINPCLERLWWNLEKRFETCYRCTCLICCVLY